MDARTPQPPLYLDAEIRPHRSLTLRGALLLFAPLVAANLAIGAFAVALRAPLVPPFLGLDVLAVGLALYISFRSARSTERVRVTADIIQVSRGRPGRARTIWTTPALFTRVDILDPGKHVVRVRLSCKGRQLDVASALGPVEREAFGRELQDALRSARGERWRS
jgi:uncharacterized membrane protein